MFMGINLQINSKQLDYNDATNYFLINLIVLFKLVEANNIKISECIFYPIGFIKL